MNTAEPDSGQCGVPGQPCWDWSAHAAQHQLPSARLAVTELPTELPRDSRVRMMKSMLLSIEGRGDPDCMQQATRLLRFMEGAGL